MSAGKPNLRLFGRCCLVSKSEEELDHTPRFASVVAIIALVIGGLGGLILLLAGGYFALIVATGGLYGSLSLKDATPATLLIGAGTAILSALPMGLILIYATYRYQGTNAPTWSIVVGWIAVLGLFGTVALNVLSALPTLRWSNLGELGVITIPFVPYLLGLSCYLLVSRHAQSR
jgi:hypothetical protein